MGKDIVHIFNLITYALALYKRSSVTFLMFLPLKQPSFFKIPRCLKECTIEYIKKLSKYMRLKITIVEVPLVEPTEKRFLPKQPLLKLVYVAYTYHL